MSSYAGYFWSSLLVVIVLACQIGVQASLDSLRVVNEKIKAKEPSLDPEANMEVARELFLKIEAPPYLSQTQREVFEVLDKFKIIDYYVSKPECGDQSNGMREYLVKILAGSSYDRLILIADYYSKRLAQVCQLEYAKMYAKMYAILKLHREPILEPMNLFLAEHVVETLTDDKHRTRSKRVLDGENSKYWSETLALVNDGKMRVKLIERFIKGDDVPLASQANAENAYDVMNFFAQNSSDEATRMRYTLHASGRARLLNPTQVEKLFKVLIVDVCEKYVPYIAENCDVFEWAEADLKYLANKDLAELESHELARYYLDWAQFTSCWKMLNDEDDLNRLTALILQTAEEKVNRLYRP